MPDACDDPEQSLHVLPGLLGPHGEDHPPLPSDIRGTVRRRDREGDHVGLPGQTDRLEQRVADLAGGDDDPVREWEPREGLGEGQVVARDDGRRGVPSSQQKRLELGRDVGDRAPLFEHDHLETVRRVEEGRCPDVVEAEDLRANPRADHVVEGGEPLRADVESLGSPSQKRISNPHVHQR